MMEPVSRTNEAVRERSGDHESEDRLVAMLYLLMRDHLPAGVIESVVTAVTDGPSDAKFTNGWLAKYAEDLAGSLRGE